METDKEFLKSQFNELLEEMRWRRNVEFRLLQFTLLLYSVIGVGMVNFYQSAVEKRAYFFLTITTVILFLIFMIMIHGKIVSDHRVYEILGKQVQRIWRYFRLPEEGAYLVNECIVDPTFVDPGGGFGHGHGYKRTLTILWIVGIAMMITVLFLGVSKLWPQMLDKLLSYLI